MKRYIPAIVLTLGLSLASVATASATSWWFVAGTSLQVPLQIGPFATSAACIKIANAMTSNPSGTIYVLGGADFCFSSTGETAKIE
jgi:hypothetical protein